VKSDFGEFNLGAVGVCYFCVYGWSFILVQVRTPIYNWLPCLDWIVVLFQV
jgi:hypothetical protein